MNVRGTVVEVGDRRTVSTRYGERDLAPVRIRNGGDESRVTLWGDWAETAEWVEPGMELSVSEVETSEYDGREEYATTGDSYVVVEPDHLVDVTDVRAWVQCPRMHYLNHISGTPLAYPVVRGTVVHQVFGDLLRGADLDEAVADRVAEAGMELDLLGRDADAVRAEVEQHARALEGWLRQGTLSGEDGWRSEQTLVGGSVGLKGRCDAIRRGMPVELKTGKNTGREPRFHDKVQAACYALLLRELEGRDADTGVVLYTNNATLDRSEAGGDLAAAKEFSIGDGLLRFVVRKRNELAATAAAGEVPTGHEADADCSRCFERDHCMVVSGRLDHDGKAGRIGTPVPEEERAYFERWYGFLEAERAAVHEEYGKLLNQTAEERAADNRALIDLEPTGRRRLDDGRWELRAEKPADAVSNVREGDLVLASDGDPVLGELVRVEEVGPEEVVVVADEPVELRRLDSYPSEVTIDRTTTALYDFVLKGDEGHKDVLFGRREPRFGDESGTFVENNEAQNRAVARAVAAEDFALIHGPPGTGKTYTIARLIRALADRGERVLLSAHTNRAVDNALGALRDQGFERFARMGTATGISAEVLPSRIDTRGDGAADELREAPVVAATTATCGSRVMRETEFDVAVVDEASQLTEPDTLAAINRADRFVLVGDHEQLPAVTGTDPPPSLFERLVAEHPEASVMLRTQYRMAQRIQAFPSREFYDGALRPATPEVAGQHLTDLDGVPADALPDYLRDQVALVDAGGTVEGNVSGREAERVVEVVADLRAAGVPDEAIGVIAPFRAQVAEIDRRLDGDVTVDTVDRFQGSSKEVVVISFAAAEGLESPVFDDHRRLNVALTRPRKALVLVGDADALSTDGVYGRMVEWSGGAVPRDGEDPS